MFDFLKKKISSWISKDKNKPLKRKNNSKKIDGKSRKKLDKLIKEKKESLQKAEDLLKETQSQNLEVPKPSEIKENKEIDIAPSNFFTKLIKKITSSKLSQENFDEAFQDLEITLLENNVALEAVDAIREKLSKDFIGRQMKKTEAPARILVSLKEAIISLLIEPPNLAEKIKSNESPFVIIFFGINGTGKTTTIAKVAHLLKKERISCVLAAGDTFRAASIEQLRTHAESLKINCISAKYGADPASVAFDAIQYAKKHSIQVVLIDTAGRMYTKANLMKEMEKIIRVSEPNLKIFVGESITGNDVIEQAKTFTETIGIDGIILTKADIDEKAGTILSVSHITKKPIYFLGIGQNYDDLLPFTKKEVLKNLGLG